MSKLQQDAAAFKSVMHRQDFTSWHSKNGKPAAAASVAAASSSSDLTGGAGDGDEVTQPSPKKKNRQKSSMDESFVAPLILAVQRNCSGMKQKPGPMRLEDIALFTDTPLDTDLMLREKFKAHDKIQFDHKTGLYSYKYM
ncbi:hypothetical protein DFP72DRAFT_851721 [Ephemerocybe angulata]|uniref:TFIIE beta domain-containing protein n=1 Tax=Ephemerocybe angulata TaxID=980116 RepID=A0A8H6HR28_9AGAR|nr:hypothetical protein DFP72DRAFT_851721 [Tulosesus angulatus]